MVEQGSIFGIPLEKNMGFAYVQCIYPGDSGFIPVLMLKVFNYHSKSLETGVQTLKNSEELCYPFLMMGEPVLKGKNKWYRIGVESIDTTQPIHIPDLRVPIGGTALIDNTDWSNVTWEVIFNFNYRQPFGNLPYSSIKHLGIWRHSSSVAITEFLSMIWLQKLGKRIEDYYTNDEVFGRKNFWKRGAFYESINITFYSEVDKKYWGKVIPFEHK